MCLFTFNPFGSFMLGSPVLVEIYGQDMKKKRRKEWNSGLHAHHIMLLNMSNCSTTNIDRISR